MAGKPLTKAQVVTTLSEKLDITKKDVNNFLDTLNDLAYKETKKNGAFTLPGLGKLVLVKRKARMGRNPATGEAIKIKAKTVVKFRVAKACKDTIIPPK
jgi:DNA-binding protein HU-beta